MSLTMKLFERAVRSISKGNSTKLFKSEPLSFSAQNGSCPSVYSWQRPKTSQSIIGFSRKPQNRVTSQPWIQYWRPTSAQTMKYPAPSKTRSTPTRGLSSFAQNRMIKTAESQNQRFLQIANQCSQNALLPKNERGGAVAHRLFSHDSNISGESATSVVTKAAFGFFSSVICGSLVFFGFRSSAAVAEEETKPNIEEEKITTESKGLDQKNTQGNGPQEAENEGKGSHDKKNEGGKGAEERKKESEEEAPAISKKASSSQKKHVVILGTGWGAVHFLKHLDPKLFNVTIVSPRNYFLFTPLLPSTTVGTVDTKTIVDPIREFAKRAGWMPGENCEFYEAEAEDVWFDEKKVVCRDTSGITTGKNFLVDYDKLIIGVGGTTNTFNTPGVEEYTYFLKSIPESMAIRNQVIDCLETAYLPSTSQNERDNLLHFVVVGGGPTGVEVAAEIHDFLHEDLVHIYPEISKNLKLTLVQSNDHLLNSYDEAISNYCEKKFARDGIEVLTGTRVVAVNKDSVVVSDKKTKEKIQIPFGLCVWSTGLAPLPVTKNILQRLKPHGQKHHSLIWVDDTLQMIGTEGVFALGDCCAIYQKNLFDSPIELFKQFDTDNSGTLSKREFKRFVQRMAREYPQLSVTSKKIVQEFEQFDTDGNGELSLDEFKHFLKEADRRLKSLPATGQVAAQQGEYLAKALNQQEQFGTDPERFVYKHKGSLAYVGSDRSSYEIGSYQINGAIAWFLWRSVYLSKQPSWRNFFNLMWDWTKSMFLGRDTSRF